MMCQIINLYLPATGVPCSERPVWSCTQEGAMCAQTCSHVVAAIVQSFGNAKRSKDESKEGPAFKIDPKDSDIKDLPSTNSTPSPWSHNGIVNSKSFCFKQDSLKSISSLGSSSLMPCQKDFTRLGLNMSSKSSWLPKKDWITVTGSKNEKPASSLQDFLGFQHGMVTVLGKAKVPLPSLVTIAFRSLLILFVCLPQAPAAASLTTDSWLMPSMWAAWAMLWQAHAEISPMLHICRRCLQSDEVPVSAWLPWLGAPLKFSSSCL